MKHEYINEKINKRREFEKERIQRKIKEEK